MLTIHPLFFSLLFSCRTLGLLGRHPVYSLGAYHLREKNPMATAQRCTIIETGVHTVASETRAGEGVGWESTWTIPGEEMLN